MLPNEATLQNATSMQIEIIARKICFVRRVMYAGHHIIVLAKPCYVFCKDLGSAKFSFILIDIAL